MNEDRINSIENRHRMLSLAFVPGPWTYDASDQDQDVVKDANGTHVVECLHGAAMPVCTFIAEAYSDIPDLIAALREMTARAEAAETCLAIVQNLDSMKEGTTKPCGDCGSVSPCSHGNLIPCSQCWSTRPCEHDKPSSL